MNTDILIIGGGIAGLSIARQLRKKLPSAKITIIERASYPIPEAAVKVGESTVEMGAHYYANTLDLKQHLEKEQLFKLGLRYFFPADNNKDISKRFEMGSAQLPSPVPSYQIDRGRFENHLYTLNLKDNITILSGNIVNDVSLAENDHENHVVSYSSEKGQHTVKAKWLIDASGRFGLLKRKLGLGSYIKHDSCAAWFRVNYKVDINQWSNDKRWQFRSPLKQRRLSTNHLMGEGYWVWLIPLVSGATSIGIVYDPKIHKPGSFKNFDDTIEWLEKHEPQLKQILYPLKPKLLDYRRLKHYAYSCKQLYSKNRWYITGEAGTFADPFYSPGNDFIGLSNTYITDLIYRDSINENIKERIEAYNNTYFEYFYLLLMHFEDQYKNFGIPFLMVQKILWDTLCAFGIPYLLFIKDKFCDLIFMNKIGNEALNCYRELTKKVQCHFKENARTYKSTVMQENYLNFSDIIHSKYYGGRIYKQLYKELDDDALEKEINSNLKLLENIANDILNNKMIIPECFISGSGNCDELWRIARKKLMLSKQNQWKKRCLP